MQKRKLSVLLLPLAAACCVLVAETQAGVQVKITGMMGSPDVCIDNWSYVPAELGMVLEECDEIRVEHNEAAFWERIDGDCSNKGIVKGDPEMEEGAAKIVHVGTDIRGMSSNNVLTAGYIDLQLMETPPVSPTEAVASEATIVEGEGCTGTGHCGLNSSIAQAAPTDPPPRGALTVYSGRYEKVGGEHQVRFEASPANQVSIQTAVLVGPNAGEILPLAPGESITYFSDGSYVYGAATPTGGCCLPGVGCVDGMTESGCNELGGDYHGDASTCSYIACPSLSEWAMIALAVFLCLIGVSALIRRSSKATVG